MDAIPATANAIVATQANGTCKYTILLVSPKIAAGGTQMNIRYIVINMSTALTIITIISIPSTLKIQNSRHI